MLSFIWDGNYLPPLAAYPPTFPFEGDRASNPQPLVYVALQHTRFTRRCCYQQPLWALTPLFHPYLAWGETVIFCGTVCSCLRRTRLFTGVLLCAVRTFLCFN